MSATTSTTRQVSFFHKLNALISLCSRYFFGPFVIMRGTGLRGRHVLTLAPTSSDIRTKTTGNRLLWDSGHLSGAPNKVEQQLQVRC